MSAQPIEARIHLDERVQLSPRALVERVRFVDLVDRLVHAADRGQVKRQPVMRGRVVVVQLERAPELAPPSSQRYS